MKQYCRFGLLFVLVIILTSCNGQSKKNDQPASLHRSSNIKLSVGVVMVAN